jgi:hypothetical protein
MTMKEVISRQQLDLDIAEAAKAAGYTEGFGIQGSNLMSGGLWLTYVRQSMEEQALNNRLPDYLRTSAIEARKLGVIIPLEYVFYDTVTGEHLERPNMILLRKLMAERKIAGIIFPALDRLSREPVHQQIFEMEATYYGIRLHYADAPNGNDPGSQFARSILAHAAKLVKLSNHKNSRGGNIGRMVRGFVPAQKAPYGYRYRREGEIGPDGRLHISRAWWNIDELGPDGKPVWGSPAWVVVQMFIWMDTENRTLYWTAAKLNEMGIKAPAGGKWRPARIVKIIRRHSYTGTHYYNAHSREPNPDHPLKDITAEVKRTLIRPKPREEWAECNVPALVDQDTWQRVNDQITKRGRGRGKQGKSIQALLRNRIFCPRCGKPMVVRRDGRHGDIYYHCSKYYQPWADKPCGFRRFIPAIDWEDVIWSDICSWLRSDRWVDEQLASEQVQDENLDKLIKLQEWKIAQVKGKIEKVSDGFDGGIYSLEQAKERLKEYNRTIAMAEEERRRLREQMAKAGTQTDRVAMKKALEILRDKNLDEATFVEKMDIISKLGIKVYPSEDLKSMKVIAQLNLVDNAGNQANTIENKTESNNKEYEPTTACGKVTSGGAEGIRTPYLLNAIQSLSQLSYSPKPIINCGDSNPYLPDGESGRSPN